MDDFLQIKVEKGRPYRVTRTSYWPIRLQQTGLHQMSYNKAELQVLRPGHKKVK